MTGLVETIWLFVRGDESVRVIRAATPEGRARLLVYGPGNTHATHEFQDAVTCTQRESELERELVNDGFTLEQFTDRRTGLDRRGAARGTSDRRRDGN
jgi:hypothetical protein